MNETLLLLATLIQALAAAAALRHTPWHTRHLLAWGALSLALVLMTVRRFLPLLPVSVESQATEATIQALLALFISMAAFTGVIGLKRLFVELADKDARLAARNQDLQRLSSTDPLTGVLNRRELLRRADAEIDRGRRYHHPTALVMFDLDHFKEVNDRFGHDMGDEVLKAFCRVAVETARTNDHFGRLGGEEFALVLPETDAEHAELVADRIRARAAELRFEQDGRPVLFTVSAGVANCDGEHRFGAAAGLLRRADLALYAAKRHGRNRVDCYRPELEQPEPAVAPVTPADPRVRSADVPD